MRLWDVLLNAATEMPGNRSNGNIESFMYMVKNWANQLTILNAYDAAALVAKNSGILKELYDDKTVEGLSRYENLQELLNGIKEFTDSEAPDITADGEIKDELTRDKSLASYLQNISLLTDADKDTNDHDRVRMMTIHSAKGLEFQCVYVVGLEENLFPGAMSLNSREDLEEERRLFYVAITRAKQKLTLSYANTRYRYGSLTYCDPSRFIDEIDPKSIDNIYSAPQKNFSHSNFLGEDTYSKPGYYPNKKSSASSAAPKPAAPKFTPPPFAYKPAVDFKPDDFREIKEAMEVEHQRFGIGKILKLEGSEFERIATIEFSEAGTKKILLKYAKLRILNKVE